MDAKLFTKTSGIDPSTMIVRAFWIICSMYVYGITIGNTYSDLDQCITKEGSDSTVFRNQYCVVTKSDVNLFCPRNKIMVILSLQLGVKYTTTDCIKRILTPRDVYCCQPQSTDNLYDGDCLQDVWSSEDKQHYRQFMKEVLAKCTNTSQCVLRSELFRTLQKEIPTTNKYASYFQIIQQCIPAPTPSLDVCSSKKLTGKVVHLQGHYNSNKDSKTNCTCRVTSLSGQIDVRAVDVRTANSGLVIKSDSGVKDMSRAQLPVFGFSNVITGRNIDVYAMMGSSYEENMWLHISGTNNQDVIVACGAEGPTTPSPPKGQRPKTSSTLNNHAITGDEEEMMGGYWPMIYVAAGSGITLVLIACILCSVLICRHCAKKARRPKPCENQYHQSQVNYHLQAQDIYATVGEDLPPVPMHRPPSSQHTLEWRRANMRPGDPRTSTMRSIRAPKVPTLPPPNRQRANRLDDTGSSFLSTTTTGVSSRSGASETDAFFEPSETHDFT